MVGVKVAADLGLAVVATVVPFAVGVRFALGFVGVVTGAVGAVQVADEGGLGLLDVAHGVDLAVRVVEGGERGAGACADLGVGPLVPDAAGVLTSSAFAGRLSEVRVFAAAVALLVGGAGSVGLELTVGVLVALSLVGAVGGADTSAAVVDAVPGAAVLVLVEDVGGAAGFAVVAEAAVFEALAVGGVPVALVVAEAERGGSVVALHAAALAFKELAFKRNGVAFSLGVAGLADDDLAGVAPGGPFAFLVFKTFVNVGVQAGTNFAAVGGGIKTMNGSYGKKAIFVFCNQSF